MVAGGIFIYNLNCNSAQTTWLSDQIFDNLGLKGGRTLIAPDAAVSQTSVLRHAHPSKTILFFSSAAVHL